MRRVFEVTDREIETLMSFYEDLLKSSVNSKRIEILGRLKGLEEAQKILHKNMRRYERGDL